MSQVSVGCTVRGLEVLKSKVYVGMQLKVPKSMPSITGNSFTTSIVDAVVLEKYNHFVVLVPDDDSLTDKEKYQNRWCLQYFDLINHINKD